LPASRPTRPISDRKKVVILGGGPNRIGQGIEFDYCCCHAAFALQDAGYETIMVNCNPETVSTDYDTSDRLYFEPLTAEDVLEILNVEKRKGTLHGVIVQFGGQTPLKLAQALEDAGVPILGTSPDMIDLAEDRDRFQKLLHKLGLKQPQQRHRLFGRAEPPDRRRPRLPLVVRPSYVLGGRAMQIIRDEEALNAYLLGTCRNWCRATCALSQRQDRPDQHGARQEPAAVRQLSDGRHRGRCRLRSATAPTSSSAGIMEHIEEAGIHSGDSACSLPPHSLGGHHRPS
jgi:carbamoyl-phosphate synthase large subunit